MASPSRAIAASKSLCASTRSLNARPRQRQLSARDMEVILGVTSALAAPFELMTMLGEVVVAAKQVLSADRGSVWLYDAATDELVRGVVIGMQPLRVSS